MMFEHRTAALLPMRAFLARVARFGAVSAGIVGFSLCIGAAGYHYFGALPWIDALLNAAMILTGMGPVDRMDTREAKLFATAYALYSGIAFLSTATVLFAPILHRLLHSLHFEAEDEAKRGGPS
jgi:hypothetical protein